MKIDRLHHLLSPGRLAFCREHFRQPGRALRKLAFLDREPFELVDVDGGRARFTRDDRDHVMWDWILANRPGRVRFSEHGELRLETPTHTVLLRPGTKDFTVYREVFLDDLYGLCSVLSGEIGNVIDLGANAGVFTAAALGRAKRVVAVEPMPGEHAQALRNAAANGASGEDVLQRAAFARSGEMLKLYLGHRTSTVTSLAAEWAHGEEEGESIEVETISLRELVDRFGDEPIDLVKCDVEGAEYGIFETADEALLRRIRRIHMEAHIGPGLPESQLTELRTKFERAGFAIEERVPLRWTQGSGSGTLILWMSRPDAA